MLFKLTRWPEYVYIIFLLVVVSTLQVSAHDFGGASFHGEPPGSWNSSSGGGGGGKPGPNGQKNNRGGNVYMYDGSEYFSTTDLALKGVFPIVFSRDYNSQSTYDSALGYGWDFVYNHRLFTYADNSVTIRWRTGFKQRFIFSGGAYVSEFDTSDTLIKHLDGTFTLTNYSGLKWSFDINGNLTQIKDNHGNSLRLFYSSTKKPLIGVSPFSATEGNAQIVSYDHQLIRIEEWNYANSSTGRFVDLSYQSTTGRLSSISDFSGRTVSYGHDINGNLVRIDFPEGLYTSYTYGDPNDIHNITEFKQGYGTNAAKTLYSNEYDTQDRVFRQFHGNGSLEFEYTIPLMETKITKNVGNSAGDVLHQFTEIVQFDDKGYTVKFTNSEKNVFETIRDGKGNPIREVLWKNVGTITTPNLKIERVINKTFNSYGNMTSFSTSLESGEVITGSYSYDHGWLQSWRVSSSLDPEIVFQGEYQFEYTDVYPKHISRSSVKEVADGLGQFYVIDFEYTTSGELSSVTYPNGDQENYTYSNGYLINSNGTIFARDALGQFTSVTDKNNNVTQYEYDQLGRLIKEINALNEEVVFRYTGFELTEIESGIYSGIQGTKFRFSHDDLGNLIKAWVDVDGTPTMERNYSYDSDGGLLNITNSLDQNWMFSYDPQGRLNSMQKPGSNAIVYQYDFSHLPTKIIDSNGETTTYSYDRLDRLIRVNDARQQVTEYSYNAIGYPTKITTAENRKVYFDYDLMGRVISKQDELGRKHEYVYDSKGRLSKNTDPDGIITNFQYSDRDLLTGITFPGTPNRELSFDYDYGNNLISYTDTLFSTTPMTTWTYDALNRVNTVNSHDVGKVLDYDYNHTGLREKLACFSGGIELFSYHYLYDKANLPVSITALPQNKVVQLSHDTEGRLVERTSSNGTRVVRSYTSDSQTRRIEYKKEEGLTLDYREYSYDVMGNILTMDSSRGISTFAYSPNYQVTSADYPFADGLSNELFTYDGNGNRLSSSYVSDWEYDSADQLLSFGNIFFEHDGRGNTISATEDNSTTQYTYDDWNNLIAITSQGVSTQYVYDHLKRRVKKSAAGTVTKYLYDEGSLIAEFDESGNLSRNYLYNIESDDLLAIQDNGDIYSVMTDHIGRPTMIFNGDEVPVWKAAHQLFGNTVINEDLDGDGNSFICNNRFPGQYYDSESGLYYNIARYYDPHTGRYLQQDPILGDYEQPTALNPYTYAANNPLTFVDPLGLTKRRGRAAQVMVLTEEDMRNIAKSMAKKLKYEVNNYYIRWYNPFTWGGILPNSTQMLRFATTFDSVFNDTHNPNLPSDKRLYTFENDPKGRVYAGNELNYILQGMLYEHLGMPWAVTEFAAIHGWKRIRSSSGGSRLIPTSFYWARRGRAMYSKIMAEYEKNPRVKLPDFRALRTVTLGDGNYHTVTPDPK